MQRPSSLKGNTEFYSHYKSTTTLKGLVGITPSGVVSFVSVLHPGSVSDNAITRNSDIPDLLEKGEQVMVVKDFPDSDSSAVHQAKVTDTQAIAWVCVHVERAIRRLKCYHIFDRVGPLTFVGSFNQMWTVRCLLTNVGGSLLQAGDDDRCC